MKIFLLNVLFISLMGCASNTYKNPKEGASTQIYASFKSREDFVQFLDEEKKVRKFHEPYTEYKAFIVTVDGLGKAGLGYPTYLSSGNHNVSIMVWNKAMSMVVSFPITVNTDVVYVAKHRLLPMSTGIAAEVWIENEATGEVLYEKQLKELAPVKNEPIDIPIYIPI